MPLQSWAGMANGAPPWQTTSGTALNTATTATISPQVATGKDFAVPANYFYPGKTLRVWARGYFTTTATTSNFTVFLAANLSNAGSTFVTLATTAAIASGATAATGLPWWLAAYVTCTAAGSTGNTMSTQGSLFVQSTAAQPSLSGGTSNILHFGLPAAQNAASASTVDTTSPQGIALRCTSSVAGPTIQCFNFDIEEWN